MNLGGVIHLNKTGICLVCGCIIILFLYVFSKGNHETTLPEKGEFNLKEILKIAITAAENGGIQVVSTKDYKIENKGETKEGANDSVTSADKNSHCAMTEILKHSFPALNIMSEEQVKCDEHHSAVVSSNLNELEVLNDEFVSVNDIIIWIDPLDATKEYTENLKNFVTTMVCVAVKGKPIIGVIHKPYTKETYWGWDKAGHSSNLNNKLSKDEGKIKIIISRSHSGSVKDLIKNKFKDYTLIEAGGSGCKVLELVNGNADVYIHNTEIKKWDICAGNAILSALGGKLTTTSGEDISYSSNLSPVNKDGLLAAMKNYDEYLKLVNV